MSQSCHAKIRECWQQVVCLLHNLVEPCRSLSANADCCACKCLFCRTQCARRKRLLAYSPEESRCINKNFIRAQYRFGLVPLCSVRSIVWRFEHSTLKEHSRISADSISCSFLPMETVPSTVLVTVLNSLWKLYNSGNYITPKLILRERSSKFAAGIQESWSVIVQASNTGMRATSREHLKMCTQRIRISDYGTWWSQESKPKSSRLPTR